MFFNRWESWNIPVPGTCWLSDIIDTYLDPEVRYRCCDGCDRPAGPHLTSARHSSQGIASFAINQSTTSQRFGIKVISSFQSINQPLAARYRGHFFFAIYQHNYMTIFTAIRFTVVGGAVSVWSVWTVWSAGQLQAPPGQWPWAADHASACCHLCLLPQAGYIIYRISYCW